MNAMTPPRPGKSRAPADPRLTSDTYPDLDGSEQGPDDDADFGNSGEIVLDHGVDSPDARPPAYSQEAASGGADPTRGGSASRADQRGADAARSESIANVTRGEKPWPEMADGPTRPRPVGAIGGIPARLSAIEVTVTVEIGRRQLPIRDLLTSVPGQLFALDSLTDDPVDVLVNGRLFARGEVVHQGERYAVRLTSLAEQEG